MQARDGLLALFSVGVVTSKGYSTVTCMDCNVYLQFFTLPMVTLVSAIICSLTNFIGTHHRGEITEWEPWVHKLDMWLVEENATILVYKQTADTFTLVVTCADLKQDNVNRCWTCMMTAS